MLAHKLNGKQLFLLNIHTHLPMADRFQENIGLSKMYHKTIIKKKQGYISEYGSEIMFFNCTQIESMA